MLVRRFFSILLRFKIKFIVCLIVGSQRLEVWGQTRSASRSSEVVPSPRGDRVLFKSNAWNPNNQQMGYVYDSETAMPRGSITSVTGGTLPTSPPVTPQPTVNMNQTTGATISILFHFHRQNQLQQPPNLPPKLLQKRQLKQQQKLQ